MKSSWWRWDWDTDIRGGVTLEYDRVTRWRRGWVTLYRMEDLHGVRWALYLPFNLFVGWYHPTIHGNQ